MSTVSSREARSTSRRAEADRVQRWAWIGILGVLLTLAILTVWMFPVLRSVQLAVFDVDQSAGPDPGVNLNEVSNHYGPMIGHEVTISGRVDEVLSPQAMIIGNHAPLISDTVLIVSSTPLMDLLGRPPEEVEVARVTGIVETLERIDLQQNLGISLGAGGLEAYGGQSILIANAATPDPPFAIGPGDKEFPSSSDWYDISVTTDDIIANPERYVDQQVTVSAEIETFLVPQRLIAIDDDTLLVVSPEPRPDAVVEATAVVIGTVRMFDPLEIEQEFGVDIPDRELDRYEGEAVIIADQIELIK